MSKAPKKIWVTVAQSGELLAKYTDYMSGNKYIRADLVDELVSLLTEWKNVTAEENKAWDEYENRVDSAIAALKEEE
jgi:hypothetical protein